MNKEIVMMWSTVLDCVRPRRALEPECVTPRAQWNACLLEQRQTLLEASMTTLNCVSSRTKTDASRSFYDVTKLRANMSLATLSNRLHNIAKHKELSAMH